MPNFAADFGKRWTSTRRGGRRGPMSMPSSRIRRRLTFGEQIPHIATINYALCAALKDLQMPDVKVPEMKEPDGKLNTKTPSLAGSVEKQASVKYLADSFDYCSSQIAGVTDAQMNSLHSTPDGTLNGRELLLAPDVHPAHHRGQAEIELRIKGIKPPPYTF